MGLMKRLGRRFSRVVRPLWKIVVAGDRIAHVPGAIRASWRTSASPIATPELTGANLLPDAEARRQATYSAPEAVVAILEGVRFDARHHVVLTGRRRLLVDSVNTGDERHLVGLRHLVYPREVPLSGTFTAFRSYQNTHYHTLIDNLPRLYLLHPARAALGVEAEVLCGSPLSPAEAWLLPLLAPPGTRVRQVDPALRYRVERFVFLGFLTRPFAGWLPPEYLEWFRERVVPTRPPGRHRRIWISRRVIGDRHMRNVVNESAVIDALAPFGFEAVRLEGMTTPQQIELFYDAEMVIAPHGAGLANLVFGTGAQVLELFPSRWVVPHYYLLAKACGHGYAWLNAHGRHRDSNFTASVADIVRQVRRWESA